MQGWAGQNNTFQMVLLDGLGNPYQGTDAVLLQISISPADQALAISAGRNTTSAQGMTAEVLDISRCAVCSRQVV